MKKSDPAASRESLPANQGEIEKNRRDGLYLVLLGSVMFILLGYLFGTISPRALIDFKIQYVAARCSIQHLDPYNSGQALRTYTSERLDWPAHDDSAARMMVTHFIYPPSVLSVTSLIAFIPFRPAALFWVAVNTGSFIFASFLIWNVAASHSPVAAGGLVGFMLANSEILAASGNLAGISISLCVLAAVCLNANNSAKTGIACLALSLMLKPQLASLVWLHFVLRGGIQRKRALQSLLVAGALSLPSVFWVTSITRNWPRELHSNLITLGQEGHLTDPSPNPYVSPGSMINLQTIISVIRNEPAFYNSITYLVCGSLIAIWATSTVRRPLCSSTDTWIALAAIATFTLLVVYHRRDDSGILLLSIPACSTLWSKRDRVGHIALLLTSAAFFFAGDNPWLVSFQILNHLHLNHKAFADSLQIPIQVLPAPLSLLTMGAFYVGLYLRRTTLECASSIPTDRTNPGFGGKSARSEIA